MKRILLSLLALGSIASLTAAPISYTVTLDSSAISGSTAGYIEFQFNQANASTSQAATASVSNFTSTGFMFDDLSNYSLGAVSGSLSAPPLAFDNTGGGTNLFDQGVSHFGSGFSFTLTLDGDALSNTVNDGSEFFVYLLDSGFNNLAGPDGTVVASVVINGNTTVSLNPVNGFSTITPASSDAPEPSAISLFGIGGAMVLSLRFLRLRRVSEFLKRS